MRMVTNITIDNVTNKTDGKWEALCKMFDIDDHMRQYVYDLSRVKDIRILRILKTIVPKYMRKEALRILERLIEEHNIRIINEQSTVICDNGRYKVRVCYTIEWDE